MSFAWSFHSVFGAAFNGYFGGPCPDRFEAMVAALTSDDSVVDEEQAEFVARHIATHGLRYSSLNEAQSTLLDECFVALTHDELFADDLGLIPESPDFVHPSVVESLLRAARADNIPTPLLPTLLSGRRFGAAEPTPGCCYFVLAPREAGQLASELSAVLAATKNWGKEAWMPDLVNECLLGPMRSVEQAGRHLVGRLG